MVKKKFFIEIGLTILGTMLSGIATSCFLLPNKLSSGGFSGIATIVYYFLNIQMGITIILLNIPLFIIAYFRLGKYFLFKSIIGTVSLSLFIDLFEKLPSFTDDRFLASIYGGILMGIGLSLVFKAHNSTGGSDLIVQIVQTFARGLRASEIINIVDIGIVTLNLIFFGEIEIGLYSAIAIYLSAKMIDIVFEGINFSKLVYIISDKSEEISERIQKDVQKGATGLYGKGMYFNQNKIVLMSVVKRREIVKLREIVNEIDKNAFFIITNAIDVYGLGFKEKVY